MPFKSLEKRRQYIREYMRRRRSLERFRKEQLKREREEQLRKREEELLSKTSLMQLIRLVFPNDEKMQRTVLQRIIGELSMIYDIKLKEKPLEINLPPLF